MLLMTFIVLVDKEVMFIVHIYMFYIFCGKTLMDVLRKRISEHKKPQKTWKLIIYV